MPPLEAFAQGEPVPVGESGKATLQQAFVALQPPFNLHMCWEPSSAPGSGIVLHPALLADPNASCQTAEWPVYMLPIPATLLLPVEPALPGWTCHSPAVQENIHSLLAFLEGPTSPQAVTKASRGGLFLF